MTKIKKSRPGPFSASNGFLLEIRTKPSRAIDRNLRIRVRVPYTDTDARHSDARFGRVWEKENSGAFHFCLNRHRWK